MEDFGQGAIAPRRRGGFARNLAVDKSRLEYFRQPVWDRKNLAASLTGTISFFTIPKGQSDTLITFTGAPASKQKTLRDTNLLNAGADYSKDYNFYGIACYIVPNAQGPAAAFAENITSDMANILEGGALTMKLNGTKTIVEMATFLLPNLSAKVGASTTENISTVYSSAIQHKGFFPITTRSGNPQTVEKGTTFGVEITWDGTITLAQSYDMVIILDSDVRRPS